MKGLRGKGVLVTGGSRGIGLAAVHRFLEEGARVHLCGHEKAAVDDAVRSLGDGSVASTVCDVSQVEDVARLVTDAAASLGSIDVLANNAGISWREPFLDINPSTGTASSRSTCAACSSSGRRWRGTWWRVGAA